MSAAAWDQVQLGDIVTLHRGYDLASSQRRKGTVPIVSSSGITGYHDEAKISPPGVVTGRYGTLGEVFYVEEPFWPLNTTLYVSDFHGNDERFISYFLRCQGIGAQDSAAAVPGVNRNVLHRLPARRPPLPTQRKIAAVLSVYDDLIDNNNRRIRLLEEMAQRIYREWFVGFRYPGHDNVPVVESELGQIPEGWQPSSLGAIAKWTSGGTPRTSVAEYWDGSIPWISSGALTDFLIHRSDRYITELGARNGTRLVDRDAVILVVRGMSLAKEVRMGIAERTVAFSQDCKALVAIPGIDPIYLAFTLKSLSEKLLEMVEYAAHGTGLLATDRIQAISIAVPTPGIMERFSEFSGSIRREIAALTAQIANLDAARDLLLPRLISGEIDVTKLDIAMPEAAT